MHLSAIHLYPIKSCAALPTAEAVVEPRGLRGDRRWMVVDPSGRFITGRQQPRLTLIRAQPEAAALRLNAPDMPELLLAEPHDPIGTPVTVWKQSLAALPAAQAANDWISRYLGIDARLVFMPASTERPISAGPSRSGDLLSFADSSPVMLLSTAALDALNARLPQPVPMLRFRPNLVIDGTAAHAEDHWSRIRIGSVEFDVVRDCTRCVFVNVDPVSGSVDACGQPLATLKQYRRFDHGITFGRHAIPRGTGVVAVGDRIELVG